MLIQQLTITATPKYNFPQPAIDTSLPQRLIELSLHSLKGAQNQPFQLNQQVIQQENHTKEEIYTTKLKLLPIPLSPKPEETVVAAIDTSSIKLGETTRGLLVAVRGASVWKQKNQYKYHRLGPFIFNITEKNNERVYDTLQTEYFHTQSQHNHDNPPSLLQMPTLIAGLLERWIQVVLSNSISNGLILFDGSLTSGVPGASIRRMKNILDNARKNGNVILAFSKMTKLRFNGYLITDVLLEHRPPYIFQVAGLKTKPPVVLLGDIYVARLTHRNYSFRLDIDKRIPNEEKVEAVEKLLGNDLCSQSYPETLRLAHIFCTFTANEVLAMQHFIIEEYNLRIIDRPDMHKLLFGPFGKGEDN